MYNYWAQILRQLGLSMDRGRPPKGLKLIYSGSSQELENLAKGRPPLADLYATEQSRLFETSRHAEAE